MEFDTGQKIESEAIRDFAAAMNTQASSIFGAPSGNTTQRRRLNLDQGDVKNGLGQLVLTLIKVLHELLERQMIRRIEGGSLSDNEIERAGVTLMRQAEEIERLRIEFGLQEQDLNIDLGPLGTLL